MKLRLIFFHHRNKLVLILFKLNITLVSVMSPFFTPKQVDHMLINFKVGGWRFVKKKCIRCCFFSSLFKEKKSLIADKDLINGSNVYLIYFYRIQKSTSRLQTQYVYIVSKSLAGGFFLPECLGSKWTDVRDKHQSMKGSSRALKAFGNQMKWYVSVGFCCIA